MKALRKFRKSLVRHERPTRVSNFARRDGGLIGTGLFIGIALIAQFGTLSAQAGPVISANCTKMQDGRLLVSADSSFLQQPEQLGYRHKVCSVNYDFRKMTRTRRDEYGNVRGICLVELKKWTYLPSGICK
jgi:hypothetical protein